MRMTDTKNNCYFAERDFNLKNLVVKKGDMLPTNWQNPGSVRYLKENFGEDCVIWTQSRGNGNGKDKDSTELEVLKIQMAKMQETINLLKAQLSSNESQEAPIKEKKLTRRKASSK